MIKFEYDEIFPEDLNLEDLNEFVKMVLNKFLEGEPIEDNLECWGEYIGELIHDKYPDELSSDQGDEYKKFVSKYGPNFELGITL